MYRAFFLLFGSDKPSRVQLESRMKYNQLNRGELKRVMYVENKEGKIDGVDARIGWVEFSKTGKSIKYRGRELCRTSRGYLGNYYDSNTSELYWVSGIKKRGSNVHYAESAKVMIDDDALEEYQRLKITKK